MVPTRRIRSVVRMLRRLREDRKRIRMRKGWVQLDTRPTQGLRTPSPLPHRALPLRTAPGSATGPALLNRLCGIEKGPKGTVARGAEEGERAAKHPGSCSSLASIILPLSRWAAGILDYHSQKHLRITLGHFLYFQRDLPQLAAGSFNKTTNPNRLSRVDLGPKETMNRLFCVPVGEDS